MKKLLVVTIVLFCCFSSRPQTLEHLLNDVQAHGSSLTGLRAVFKTQPSYKDQSDYYSGYTRELLGHNIERASFHFTLPNNTARFVRLRAIYKKEKVGYIKIETDSYDSILKQDVWEVAYKYVDTDYTNQTLAAFNNQYKTRFTWTDLYEDDCRNFSVKPGELVCTDYAYNPDGHVTEEIFISREMKYEFYPLIKSRDHQAIAKNCLSFNPVRKAYGAVCLYALQQLGEPLSKAEKQLLKKTRRSRENIPYKQGDVVSFVKLRTLLSHKGMQRQCAPLKL